jgi:hypothetical protein
MVRIVSVAQLLVVVLTGSASAECARVLWQQTITPVEIWLINEAHPDVKECSEALVRKAKFLQSQGWKVGGAVDGARTVTIREDERRGYLFCLPDTVDPRGPKR